MSDIQKISDQTLTQEQIAGLLQMDINLLNLEQRSKYLWYMAERFGLDPMSKPFDAIPNKDGKLVLYANRTAAEQFRKLYRIKLEIVERGFLALGQETADVYVVRSRAELPDGRTDEALGAVPLRKAMAPEEMANAVMKAETKAKRRVTLSICGLGIPDETELDFARGGSAPALSAPKRIFPQQVTSHPAASASYIPTDDPVAHRASVELVDIKTGEIHDIEDAVPVQPAPKKYPPAVAPASVKK